MPNPYSIDLRRRIVESYENKEGTMEELGARYKVHRDTVSSYVRRSREGLGLAPEPHSGGNPTQKLFEEHHKALARYLEEDAGLTNPELVAKLVDEFGEAVRLDPSQISRALSQMEFTRKKKRTKTLR